MIHCYYLTNPTEVTGQKWCSHLTGSRTGYAPYKEPRIINIPQTELLSAGSVHDTIKFVEGNIVAGQQRYDMVYVSRINNVDLGTLNWGYSATSGQERFASSSLLNLINTSPSAYTNILCSKYLSKHYFSLYG